MDSIIGSPLISRRERVRDDKKNLIQILKDADSEAPKEELDRFVKFVTDLLYFLNIQEDPMHNVVESLRKIESNLVYYSEARNLMVEK